MGDLPDWTQATSNAGTVLESGNLGVAGVFDIDVSNNVSLVIDALGSTANTKICLQIQWFTDSTKTVSVNNQTFTALPDSTGTSFIGFEVPVYAGYLEIVNASNQIIQLSIIGSSRNVNNARILNDTAPSRRFTVTANMVSGTGYPLTRADVGPDGYNSNAQSTLTVQSNTLGTLYVQYINWGGVLSLIPILSVAATGFATTTIALPQGVVGFVFIASANNAAGNIEFDIAPAQL